MPTQAKEVRKRELTSTSGKHLPERKGVAHGNRKSGSARPDGATIKRNPFAPVKLPDGLQVKLNPFEVATIFGGHSVFSTIQKQTDLLTYLNKVCMNLFPDWKNKEWPEGTTLYDMFGIMVNLINDWGRDSSNTGGGRIGWVNGYNILDEGYYLLHTTGDDMVKFCSVDTLVDLDKVDPKLTKLILITIAKMAERFDISTWMDSCMTVEDYLLDQVYELQGDDDKDSKETVKYIQQGLEYWKNSDPKIYHKRMWSLRKTSLTKIRKMVKAYKWDTYHKKRILAWMRMAERIYTKFPTRSLRDYYNKTEFYDGQDLIYPADYMMFRWSEQEGHNAVDDEWTNFFQSQWENASISKFRRTFDLAKPLPKDWSDDPFAKLIESWMGCACFLFHSGLMRDYNGGNVSRKKRKKKKK